MKYNYCTANKFALTLMISVAHRPKEITQPLIDLFVSVWTETGEHLRENLFSNVICPRNAQILDKSSNPQLSWGLLSDLIVTLIKAKLLTFQALERQYVGMDMNKVYFGPFVC